MATVHVAALPQCVATAVCSCLHPAGTKTSPRAVGYVSFPPPLKFPFLLGSEPPILYMVPWAYAHLHTQVQVGSVIFAAFTVVTNTQTAHFTPSVVGIACIYAVHLIWAKIWEWILCVCCTLSLWNQTRITCKFTPCSAASVNSVSQQDICLVLSNWGLSNMTVPNLM